MKDDAKKISIVFMGTSDFSLKALKAICEAHLNVIAVYTREPKPFGRNYIIQKSVVHNFAEEKNIPVYCPKNFKPAKEIEFFKSLKPDVAIVSSYGLIIPKNILSIPDYGFINIHASLLPRWRGASPIQSAIIAGDKKTGVTIMKMNEGIDTGDIISAQSVNISIRTTYGELVDKLGDLGACMILETLNDIDGNFLKSKKQTEIGAIYTKKITNDSCQINWEDSAENILRRIMAFSPIPAAWTEIFGIRMKIFDAEIVSANNLKPGSVSEDMIVSCKNGALKLTMIQPSGKNKMSGEEFMRGKKSVKI